MQLSPEGFMELISHEAIVLSPYLDSKGVWTIGIGHTKAAGGINPEAYLGKKITTKQAIEQFRADVAKFEAETTKAFTRPLSQTQFDAAVSFAFNTGAIRKATWVKTFNRGDTVTAILEIMNWSNPKEIIPRRKKEQVLFSSGLYSGGGLASTYPADSKGRILWGQGTIVELKDIIDQEEKKKLGWLSWFGIK